ncbi:hypothetical protein [Kribbella sp. NBC_00359]|uniref:hypothetical protein n=1 Tax=Kribbella sp. NBC_00359 TaxID=2975966 RepID=UPI002E2124E0
MDVNIAYLHHVVNAGDNLPLEFGERGPRLIVNRAGADLAERADDVRSGLAQ